MAFTTDAIWMDFRSQLKHYIMKRVSDPSAADDILQDVFVKIHTKIDTLDDDTKIENWIYKITQNTIIDYYRTRKIESEIPPTVPLLDRIPEKIDVKKGVVSVQSMIEDLPKPYAEALFLTEFKGLTQKELAQKLGISISGAKSRVQRAQKMLGEKLKESCRFEYNRHGSMVDYQCTDAFHPKSPKKR